MLSMDGIESDGKDVNESSFGIDSLVHNLIVTDIISSATKPAVPQEPQSSFVFETASKSEPTVPNEAHEVIAKVENKDSENQFIYPVPLQILHPANVINQSKLELDDELLPNLNNIKEIIIPKITTKED
ncbi:uncharacterized protein LOC129875900 [Solanum dulcamara]|uniref:uncharacterized protein LOC129875900 n=1 Tax=Solanum dulcamara TaxID=45834 RepID=UPI002485980C|nr:uncharacterized protein LOC129875900 [Solanum dulcamara]